MTASEKIRDDLAGETIRDVFKHAEVIADLHACLTSSRGSRFRFRLLQTLEVPLEEKAIDQLRSQLKVNEYHRHLNWLLGFGMVKPHEIDGSRQYVRTALAERGINVLRELERRISKEAAETIYSASLGPNSIRLFLRIYGDRTEANWEQLQVVYTPAELGKLSLFLLRIIEGISAVDKLNVADLVVYRDDNHIHVQPVKAVSFYQYLRKLYAIVRANWYHCT